MLRYDEIIKILKEVEKSFSEDHNNEKLKMYAQFVILSIERKVKDRIKEKNERKNKKWFKLFS